MEKFNLDLSLVARPLAGGLLTYDSVAVSGCEVCSCLRA